MLVRIKFKPTLPTLTIPPAIDWWIDHTCFFIVGCCGGAVAFFLANTALTYLGGK